MIPESSIRPIACRAVCVHRAWMSEDQRSALLFKYQQLRALRLEARRGTHEPPRQRLRELAARFPGALRELDRLAPAELDARIAWLQTPTEPTPAWVTPIADYHGWMRTALGLRQALGKVRSADRAREWLTARVPGEGEPSNSEVETVLLDLLNPPEGRLSKFVLRHLANRDGLDPDAVENLLFEGADERS